MINSILQKEPLYTFKMSELLPPNHNLVVNINSRILSLVLYSHKPILQPIVQQRVLNPCAFRIFLALLSQPVGCSEFLLSATINLPDKEWEELLPDLCTIVLKTEESIQFSSFDTTIVTLPSPLTKLTRRWQDYLEEAQRNGVRREEIRFLQRHITRLRHDLEVFYLRVPFYDPAIGYCLVPLLHS